MTSWEDPDFKIFEIGSVDSFNVSTIWEDRTPWENYETQSNG